MEPIAVVGLGCVLPGARTPAAFWQNLLARNVALGPVPATAWDHARYFDADPAVRDRTHCQVGGFVRDFTLDWRKFRVPPADVGAVNPLQWMILEAGAQALEEAGALPRETTGIILGATGLGWQPDQGLRIRLDDMLDAVRAAPALEDLSARSRDQVLARAAERLRARLKEVSEDNVVGASASVAAGRLNMHFDLKGPHYAVDAGFGSALAAVDLAVRALRDGELDLVLTGGASELLSPLEMIAFSKLGGLSARVGLEPLTTQADGTLLGEGVALLALKRLADAERDKNKIYALLRGVGGATDGRGKSLVAPNPEGQALAMRRALADAGEDFTAASVGFIECHATGTPVGDASEVRALTAVYGESNGKGERRVALGSAKANLGHLRAGAGAAGLLKAVLSLHHREVPPQPGDAPVSPRLELHRTPFYVPRRVGAYVGALPRAAVSAFSFGGVSYHAVLEAHEHGVRTQARANFVRPLAEPMALVGRGGRFPGADNMAEFATRLHERLDRTVDIPAARYDISRYFDASGTRKDKAYTRLGCFLDELPTPPPRFRVPPAAFASLDPSHALVLLAAEEALADARFDATTWDLARVGVSLAFLPYQGKKFLADIRVNWNELAHELTRALEEARVPPATQRRLLEESEARFKAGLPPITEDTLTGYLGSLNAGRLAWLHDFHGPHFVVDSACASTHAALHAAWKMLTHRTADVVLSGGVWADMMPEFFVAACRFNALSAKGSFPFALEADGFVPGEGVGVMVLKRLSDAERDQDRIHAIIRSVSGSSDGKGRSVLAPSVSGEALALTRALELAQVAPSSVDYVECHGTGTALGDVVEATAAAQVYGPGRDRPLLLGSVKSNIGHLNAAAGAAGLLKASLMVERGVMFASLKAEHRNPKLPPAVEVVSEERPWKSGPQGGPRRAGVSAFGVGGANFHAIIEEYRPPSKPAGGRGGPPDGAASGNAEPVLLAFAGANARACVDQLAGYLEQLGGGLPHPRVPGADGPTRLALTAASGGQLRRKLGLLEQALRQDRPRDFLASAGIFLAQEVDALTGAPVAFLYPGQGGQYPNMLWELAHAYPSVQATLDEADAIYQELAGRPLTRAFFTRDAASYRQPDEDIHAAVLVVNVALGRLLAAHGIDAAIHLGQSAGELAALVATDALSLREALVAIRARTLAVLELPGREHGQMAALACSAAQVGPLLDGLPGFATLAADNGPRACIVSADRAGMAALRERCVGQGLELSILPVSHGYHSALIADARTAYRQALVTLGFRSPRALLVSSIDGAAYGSRAPSLLPDFLARQLVEPVRLSSAVKEAYRRGARVFLEAGPKWALTQFTREILEGEPHGAMASIHPKVGELEQLRRCLGFCFVHRLGRLSEAPESPSEGSVMRTSSSSPLEPGGAPTPEQVLLELPLEGVLEEASARRVLVALAKRMGVDARDAGPEDVADFGAMVTFVLSKLEEASETAPVSPEPPERSRGAEPVHPERSGGAPELDVRRVVLDETIARTGYPEEMLEPELDLEAELGIDTVKQVDIFAAVRSRLGLVRDPAFALRDFNTLAKAVAHFEERVKATPGKASPAPRAAVATEPRPKVAAKPVPTSSVSRNDVQAMLVGLLAEKTGYPAEMLELDLDLEAELGIDTVKQVDVFAKAREQLGLVRDPSVALRDLNTLRKVVDHLFERAHSGKESPVQPERPVRPERSREEQVTSELLALDLEKEAGLSSEERARLAKAVSSKLGATATAPKDARTLSELVKRRGGSRK